MALPNPFAVESRFRRVALAGVGLFLLGVLCYSVDLLLEIFREENVLTTSEVVDAGIRNTWGPMPYFLIQSTTSPFDQVEAFAAGMVASHGFGGKLPPKLYHDPVPEWQAWHKDSNVKVSEDGHFVLVNATMLTPDLGSESEPAVEHSAPELLILCLGKDPYFMLWTIEPSTPSDQLVPPYLNLSMHHAQLQAEFWAHEQPYITTQRYGIEQSAEPLTGRFWGFPGEGDHTHKQFELKLRRESYSGRGFYYQQGCARQQLFTFSNKKCTAFYFVVSNPLINKVMPVSIGVQLTNFLSSLGGLVTAFSTVFYLGFVRKYPKSETEVVNSELTLIGFMSKEREERTEPLLVDSRIC